MCGVVCGPYSGNERLGVGEEGGGGIGGEHRQAWEGGRKMSLNVYLNVVSNDFI